MNVRMGVIEMPKSHYFDNCETLCETFSVLKFAPFRVVENYGSLMLSIIGISPAFDEVDDSGMAPLYFLRSKQGENGIEVEIKREGGEFVPVETEERIQFAGVH
jgi:hypothetical protein